MGYSRSETLSGDTEWLEQFAVIQNTSLIVVLPLCLLHLPLISDSIDRLFRFVVLSRAIPRKEVGYHERPSNWKVIPSGIATVASCTRCKRLTMHSTMNLDNNGRECF